MAETCAIGIDIGGSFTKIGAVSRSGLILKYLTISNAEYSNGKLFVWNIVSKLTELISWVRDNEIRPIGVGVSVCGYLTPDGKSPDYINFHILDHYPLAEHLGDVTKLPVVLDNDMNCAALGEYHFGGGKGIRRLMVMTVGTGIGMGFILNGQVMRFHAGSVGNPGHIIVSEDGSVCTAGCRGCLESLASSGPISRMAEELAHSQLQSYLNELLEQKGFLSPEDVFLAAEMGDPLAQDIWKQVGEWLGKGLASWVEIFGPEVVIVGGGVSKAGNWLVEPIEREMRRVGEPYFTRRVKEVKQSLLGEVIAMLGAASLFLYPGQAPDWGRNQE